MKFKLNFLDWDWARRRMNEIVWGMVSDCLKEAAVATDRLSKGEPLEKVLEDYIGEKVIEPEYHVVPEEQTQVEEEGKQLG